MGLKETLFNDFKESMRNKETVRKNTIQSVRSAALQMEKDHKIEMTEEEYVKVVASQVKKRKSALPEFEKSGRQDLIDELIAEIDILMAYLPKQLSEDEITDIVKKTVDELGAQSMKDMGKVMGALSSQLAGKADNKLVSQIVRNVLNS